MPITRMYVGRERALVRLGDDVPVIDLGQEIGTGKVLDFDTRGAGRVWLEIVAGDADDGRYELYVRDGVVVAKGS